MKKLITAITAVTLALGAYAEMSVNDIVNKANEASYYAGNDGKADVEMKIIDKSGSTRTREFTLLRMNVKDGNQKFYVYFKQPADLYKQVFLVWKETGEGKNDSRWMWLPALNLKREIAPGDKRTSFVGSDFVYEDVSGRNLSEDTHELIETTDTQYIIKNVPKDPDSVEFSYYTMKIDKDTFLPRHAEYYDKTGKLYRTVEATKVETIQGYPTVIESVVSDLNTGGKTVNTFSDINYDIGLKENIFTERFLRRPPREVTR
ncbi:outer membrane lipoprotein-sorting protein [Pontiella agarivorans]|uniref:Outer membrane lipoprotein-sorting protein n=1 Tax=Pontiella agarivorans TaxID=3038953 RepID=A0ABU5MV76_9BACT|nr:outer membrane lipoprotein-sorting protein [Pontiella agarivorans]MDZ8118129.1 outer membrane lipoprotein-sorting protein [Pontiella agarivorans]